MGPPRCPSSLLRTVWPLRAAMSVLALPFRQVHQDSVAAGTRDIVLRLPD